jgi:hypothetical protein
MNNMLSSQCGISCALGLLYVVLGLSIAVEKVGHSGGMNYIILYELGADLLHNTELMGA